MTCSFLAHCSSLASLSSLALVAVLALGCTQEPSSGIPAASFCAEFADATCDLVERCACGAPAAAQCRATAEARCASGIISPATLASIDAGQVRYDGAAATVMVAALRSEPASCDYLLVTLGFRVGDLLTFGGLLTGTRAAGASCSDFGARLPSECSVGLCDRGVCQAVPAPGEACSGDSMCLDRVAAYVGARDIDAQLSCVIEPGATTGVCLARQPAGAECVNAQDCVTRTCEIGVCTPQIADGGACVSALECASLRCSGGTCLAADARDPATCVRGFECASNECIAGVCVASLCGEFAAAP